MVKVSRVKPSGIASRRYAQGCLYAFLGGKKDLNWIIATITSSGVRGEELEEVFKSLINFGDRSRFEQVRKACEDLGLFSSSSLI